MADTSNIKILADREDIVAVADAVRAKTGTTAALTLGGMVTAIEDINVGSDPVLQDKTVTPTTSKQTITADSGYDGLDTVTVNAIPSTYVKPTATKAAATYTPSTSNQTIAAGTYLSGAQTIKGDANLKAANIASGVSIFGVTGTHSGAEDLNAELTTQESLIAELSGILDTKAGGGEQATPVISVNSTNGLITATAGSKTSTHQLAFQAAQTITPGTTNKTIAANTYLGGVQTIKGDANLVSSNIVSGKSIFGVVGNYTGGGSGGGDTSMEDELIARTLTSYANDRVKTIGNYAFYDCSKLTTVNFPAATTISGYAFFRCYSLTTVSFPAAKTIGSYAFYGCSKLTTASFPAATTIRSSAFYYCYNLKSLYLTGSSLCLLSKSNAFSSTPIGGYSTSAGTYGSIYVPASLLASYKVATNWAYFSSRFVGI